MASKLPELISVADLAKAAGVSTKTVYRWIKKGQVKGVPVGARQIRVSVSSAMHLLHPEAERRGAKELAMSNNETEIRLGPPLRRGRECTGHIGDEIRIPLATTDEAIAKKRLRAVLQSMETHTDSARTAADLGFLVIRQKGRPAFLKYRPSKGGDRIMKRIPVELGRTLVTEEQVDRFAVGWATVLGVTEGGMQPMRAGFDPNAVTVTELASAWYEGELAARYGSHIREKTSAGADKARFKKYIEPVVGARCVASMSADRAIDAADEIARYIDTENPGLSAASRRHVLQVFNRLLNLAVFPLRILERNALPRGYLPRIRQEKAFGYLFPDEEARLMSCKRVPAHQRLFFGLQAREGVRASECLALTWKDVDLDRGIMKLDKNKTGRPRAWKMSDGTVAALQGWKKLLSPKALGTGYILVHPTTGKRVPGGKGARQLRAALREAKVDREELFEQSDTRIAIRAHDLRATFVTVALATGKSEAWVTDRTGHTTSAMLYRYKRAARTHAEAELGELLDLNEALPELRPRNDT